MIQCAHTPPLFEHVFSAVLTRR
jgi:hypothetical protein